VPEGFSQREIARRAPGSSFSVIRVLLGGNLTRMPAHAKVWGFADLVSYLSDVMNAVADAGANIDMPATPERVWRALSSGGLRGPKLVYLHTSGLAFRP
jgi:hypothetical protein